MSENLTQPPDLNITTQSSIDLEVTTTDKPGTWLESLKKVGQRELKEPLNVQY